MSNRILTLFQLQASYWSAKRHEVYGAVFDSENRVQRKLFGKWNEALYCGVAPNLKLVWRLGKNNLGGKYAKEVKLSRNFPLGILNCNPVSRFFKSIFKYTGSYPFLNSGLQPI